MSVSTLTQPFDLVFTFIGGQRHGQFLSIQTEQCLLALGDRDGANDQPLCAIYRSIDGVAIRNLDEQTLINGKPKTTHWLKQGDQIQFSNSVTLEVSQLGSISSPGPRDAVSICAPIECASLVSQGVPPADRNLERRLETLSERLDRLSDQVLGLIDAVCNNASLPESIISSDIKRVSTSINSETSTPAESTFEVDDFFRESAQSVPAGLPSESTADLLESLETDSISLDSTLPRQFNPNSFSAASFGVGETDLPESEPTEMQVDSFDEHDSPSVLLDDQSVDNVGNSDEDLDKVANQAADDVSDDDQLQISAMLQGLLSEFNEEKTNSEQPDHDFDPTALKNESSQFEVPKQNLIDSNLANSDQPNLQTGDPADEDLAAILARLRSEIDWSEDSDSSKLEVEPNSATNSATDAANDLANDLANDSSAPPTDSAIPHFPEGPLVKAEDISNQSSSQSFPFQQSLNECTEDSVSMKIEAPQTPWGSEILETSAISENRGMPAGNSVNHDPSAAVDSDSTEINVHGSGSSHWNAGINTLREPDTELEPESVEEYMNRLLARMSVSQSSDDHSASPASPTSPTSPTSGQPVNASTSTALGMKKENAGGQNVSEQKNQVNRLEDEPNEELTAEQVIPRNKSEKPISLNAMRDLANSTTRTAILQSELNQRQSRGLMMAASSGGAIVLSLYYLLFISDSLGDVPFFIGCLGLLIAIGIGIVSVVILNGIKLALPTGLILNRKTEDRLMDDDPHHKKD